MVTSNPPIRNGKANTASAGAALRKLTINNFAHLREVNLDFGDLTVLVGPQGAGKSLALQWLKLSLDGRQIVDLLKGSGYSTEKSDVLIEHIFGEGMASAWHQGSNVTFESTMVSPETLASIGDIEERLYYIPAHRALLISDGWALPFQKLPRTTPAVGPLIQPESLLPFHKQGSRNAFPRRSTIKK
jgi:hypothetical protein